MNVALQLVRSGRQHSRVEALRWGSVSRNYLELSTRVCRLATALRALGLRRGDRVALLLPNRPELIEVMYAAWHAGLVVVPINSRAHAREAAFIIEHASAAMAVVGSAYEHDLREALGEDSTTELIAVDGEVRTSAYEDLIAGAGPDLPVADVAADDLAWLFYTSGTTGRPKGAMLSHRNLRSMALSHLADIHSFRAGESVLHAAPLTHGSGLVMLACIARGARNVLYPAASFDPRHVLELLDAEQVTAIAFLAPTQIIMLTQVAGPNARALPLASVCYGGAPMFASDLQLALGAFGPVFAQIYGQGESPMTITALDRQDHERLWRSGSGQLGSVGRPRTDVTVRLVDAHGGDVMAGEAGEVAVRGDVVMAGYWDDPEATKSALRDTWLLTGDIGSFDEDGYLFLLDRSKDLIISGGNNIYPREVEEAISLLDTVQAVAVIGVPNRLWGESVHAVVVRREGAELGADEIIRHVVSHLAGYKKPRSVEFVEALPVNAYGKVEKRLLRNRHGSDLELA